MKDMWALLRGKVTRFTSNQSRCPSFYLQSQQFPHTRHQQCPRRTQAKGPLKAQPMVKANGQAHFLNVRQAIRDVCRPNLIYLKKIVMTNPRQLNQTKVGMLRSCVAPLESCRFTKNHDHLFFQRNYFEKFQRAVLKRIKCKVRRSSGQGTMNWLNGSTWRS